MDTDDIEDIGEDEEVPTELVPEIVTHVTLRPGDTVPLAALWEHARRLNPMLNPDHTSAIARCTLWAVAEEYRRRTGVHLREHRGHLRALTPDEQIKDAARKASQSQRKLARAYDVAACVNAESLDADAKLKRSRLMERLSLRGARK